MCPFRITWYVPGGHPPEVCARNREALRSPWCCHRSRASRTATIDTEQSRIGIYFRRVRVIRVTFGWLRVPPGRSYFFWTERAVARARAATGATMIVARNRRHPPQTGHDHGTALGEYVGLAELGGGWVDDQGEREGGVLADQFHYGRRGAVASPVGAELARTGPGRGHPEAAGQMAGVDGLGDRDRFRPVAVGAVQPGDHRGQRVAQGRACGRRHGQREGLHAGRAFGVELDLRLDHAVLPGQPPPAVGGGVELGLAAGVVGEVPDTLPDRGDDLLPFVERHVLDRKSVV